MRTHRLASMITTAVVAAVLATTVASDAAVAVAEPADAAQARDVPTPTPEQRGYVLQIPADAPSRTTVGILLPCGATFSLALRENPSTGFTWVSAPAAAARTRLSYRGSDTVPDPAPPGVAGSGGTRYFRYQARQCGPAVIQLNLVRPWQPAFVARQVTVRVTAA